jgi:hypothetical protein
MKFRARSAIATTESRYFLPPEGGYHLGRLVIVSNETQSWLNRDRDICHNLFP